MLNNIKYLKKSIISVLSIGLGLAIFALSANAADAGFNCRPPKLCNAIDQKFEKVRKTTKWSYNGAQKYNFITIDDDDLVRKIVETHPDQKVFNFMDIGAGDHSWAEARVAFINKELSNKNDLHFNIFSLSGDGHKNSNTIIKNGVNVDQREEGLCSLYNLSAFPIENLTAKLAELGYLEMLSSQVDLMVSAYTLFHLVDPIGTFFRMHDLMRLSEGIILIENMFGMTGHDIAPCTEFLEHTNLEFFRPKNYHAFALRRSDKNPGWFPYAYSENFIDRAEYIPLSSESNLPNPKNNLVDDFGDKGSESLRAWLPFKVRNKQAK